MAELGLFSGRYFGRTGSCTDEIVHFHSPNFAPEILTDPAYHRKIVIADTDVVEDRWPSPEECQSFMPFLSGIVFLGHIQTQSKSNSNFTLENYLNANRICGFIPDEPDRLKNAIKSDFKYQGSIDRNEIRASHNCLTIKKHKSTDFDTISASQEFYWDLTAGETTEEHLNLVIWDFGMNYGLLRHLKALGSKLRIVPPSTSPEKIIALHPDGVVVAGGPLLPGDIPEISSNVSRILGIRPLLGVGNGAILLAAAIGANIQTMNMPHYGAAIMVRDIDSTKAFFTYQCHSLAIDKTSLERTGSKISHLNLSDDTIESFVNPEYSAIGSMFSGSDQTAMPYMEQFNEMVEYSQHPI